jgi:hypothetical protein
MRGTGKVGRKDYPGRMMVQTRRGSRSRGARLVAAVRLSTRRRLVACALTGVAALLLGVSGVAAHGDGHSGDRDQGRTAARQHVTTSVVPIHRDDRGAGDDQGVAPCEHGRARQVSSAEAGPGATPVASPHGLRLGTLGPLTLPSISVPTVPGPPGGSGAGTGTAPGTPATTTTGRAATTGTAPPARAGPGPGTVAASPPRAAPPPPPATPHVTLPPLVLIPPLGLPSPPSINAVSAGSGVVLLVVVLLAMAALSVILGLRLARRSR